MQNSPEIASSKPERNSRPVWRWIIPLLIPTLALLIFRDLYYPLTAKAVSDHVLSLVHDDMLTEDAYQVLRDHGYNVKRIGTYLHIVRKQRSSVIGFVSEKLSSLLPFGDMRYKVLRFAYWSHGNADMFIPSNPGDPPRVNKQYVSRFDLQRY